MQLNFKTGGSIILTDELRAFVAGKVKKLEKLIHPLETAMADIELSTTQEVQKTGDVYRAEINLKYSGGFVRAEALESSMHHAVEVVVQELQAELRKVFGKRRDLMRRGGAMVKKMFRRFGGS